MSGDAELKYKRAVTMTMVADGWHVQEHEDYLRNFIPDLSFGVHGVQGWIEVKFCKAPPKTIGSIKHYTKGQETWLIDRGAVGGHCYLLLGVGSDGPHGVAGHLLLPHGSLRNARAATYIAAQSFAALWVPWEPDGVVRLVSHFSDLIKRSAP